jgi:hypothetical protein
VAGTTPTPTQNALQAAQASLDALIAQQNALDQQIKDLEKEKPKAFTAEEYLQKLSKKGRRGYETDDIDNANDAVEKNNKRRGGIEQQQSGLRTQILALQPRITEARKAVYAESPEGQAESLKSIIGPKALGAGIGVGEYGIMKGAASKAAREGAEKLKSAAAPLTGANYRTPAGLDKAEGAYKAAQRYMPIDSPVARGMQTAARLGMYGFIPALELAGATVAYGRAGDPSLSESTREDARKMGDAGLYSGLSGGLLGAHSAFFPHRPDTGAAEASVKSAEATLRRLGRLSSDEAPPAPAVGPGLLRGRKQRPVIDLTPIPAEAKQVTGPGGESGIRTHEVVASEDPELALRREEDLKRALAIAGKKAQPALPPPDTGTPEDQAGEEKPAAKPRSKKAKPGEPGLPESPNPPKSSIAEYQDPYLKDLAAIKQQKQADELERRAAFRSNWAQQNGGDLMKRGEHPVDYLSRTDPGLLSDAGAHVEQRQAGLPQEPPPAPAQTAEAAPKTAPEPEAAAGEMEPQAFPEEAAGVEETGRPRQAPQPRLQRAHPSLAGLMVNDPEKFEKLYFERMGEHFHWTPDELAGQRALSRSDKLMILRRLGLAGKVAAGALGLIGLDALNPEAAFAGPKADQSFFNYQLKRRARQAADFAGLGLAQGAGEIVKAARQPQSVLRNPEEYNLPDYADPRSPKFDPARMRKEESSRRNLRAINTEQARARHEKTNPNWAKGYFEQAAKARPPYESLDTNPDLPPAPFARGGAVRDTRLATVNKQISAMQHELQRQLSITQRRLTIARKHGGAVRMADKAQAHQDNLIQDIWALHELAQRFNRGEIVAHPGLSKKGLIDLARSQA